MNKTIEEILAPKPEARPRIYAYAIADQAHAPAPTARPNTSPGQRPGYASPIKSQALKGRPKTANAMVHAAPHGSALSGLEILGGIVPRALPWAGLGRAVGAETTP